MCPILPEKNRKGTFALLNISTSLNVCIHPLVTCEQWMCSCVGGWTLTSATRARLDLSPGCCTEKSFIDKRGGGRRCHCLSERPWNLRLLLPCFTSWSRFFCPVILTNERPPLGDFILKINMVYKLPLRRRTINAYELFLPFFQQSCKLI